MNKQIKRTTDKIKKIKAEGTADVFFSDALEDVHSSGTDHICSHESDKKTASEPKFDVLWLNVLSLHFSY